MRRSSKRRTIVSLSWMLALESPAPEPILSTFAPRGLGLD
jgi:hypothetical protein